MAGKRFCRSVSLALMAAMVAAVLGTWPGVPGQASAAGIVLTSDPASLEHVGQRSPQVNLLANPSFENGTQDWTAWQGSWAAMPKAGRRGSAGARVDWGNLPIVTDRVYKLVSADVPNLQVGTTYAASAWVKGEGRSAGRPVWLVIREHDDAGHQLESAGLMEPLSKHWNELTVTHTLVGQMTDATGTYPLPYVDVYVAQGNAVDGDYFFADDFALFVP